MKCKVHLWNQELLCKDLDSTGYQLSDETSVALPKVPSDLGVLILSHKGTEALLG